MEALKIISILIALGVVCCILALIVDAHIKANTVDPHKPYKHQTREYNCRDMKNNAYGFIRSRIPFADTYRIQKRDVYGRFHMVLADILGNVHSDTSEEYFLNIDKTREIGNINRKKRAIDKGRDYFLEYFFHIDDGVFILRYKEISTGRYFGTGEFSGGVLRAMGVNPNKPYFKLYYEPQIHDSEWGVLENEADLIPYKDKIQFMTYKEFEAAGYDTDGCGITVPYAPEDGIGTSWLEAYLD